MFFFNDNRNDESINEKTIEELRFNRDRPINRNKICKIIRH